jgi:photosynthetic reaction center H subunit
MGTGAITQYVDVAQLVLYAFWIFFFGLIYYLVREGHREGYPMETDNGRGGQIVGWPVPDPKHFAMRDGSTVSVPNDKVSPQMLNAEPSHGWTGAPLVPLGGNPLLAGVGPGSWADRADVPDLTAHGTPKIQPLRVTGHYGVSAKDPDPRGMPVLGADGQSAGTVSDLWIDQSEHMFRYLEVRLAGGMKSVLLPINFCRVHRDRVQVKAILSHQFADVPGTKAADRITFLEEEKIMAYYGAGTLYAEPSRAEPLV